MNPTQMNIVKYSSVAARFLKVFTAAGIAQVAVMIAGTAFHIQSFQDVTSLLQVFTVFFISGGLLGLQKYLPFQDEKK